MSSSDKINQTPSSKAEETERIETLFKELDSDGDGTINIKDLTRALKKHNLPSQNAEVGCK